MRPRGLHGGGHGALSTDASGARSEAWRLRVGPRLGRGEDASRVLSLSLRSGRSDGRPGLGRPPGFTRSRNARRRQAMRAHWLDKGGAISTETLSVHGVYFAKIPSSPEAYRVPLDRVKEERGYVAEDVVELRPQTPNLDAICAK